MNETTERGDILDDDEIIKTLNDLIQLDYDAIKAYDQALDRVDEADEEVRSDLELFKLDHERHVTDLAQVVRDLGGQHEEASRDVKGVLLEGLTALRSVTGTVGALKAMRMNEKLTNKSYAKASELQLSPIARMVVDRNLADERRHLAAIQTHIARLTGDEDIEVEEDLDRLDPTYGDRTGAPI
jgi:rubrerythrin